MNQFLIRRALWLGGMVGTVGALGHSLWSTNQLLDRFGPVIKKNPTFDASTPVIKRARIEQNRRIHRGALNTGGAFALTYCVYAYLEGFMTIHRPDITEFNRNAYAVVAAAGVNALRAGSMDTGIRTVVALTVASCFQNFVFTHVVRSYDAQHSLEQKIQEAQQKARAESSYDSTKF